MPSANESHAMAAPLTRADLMTLEAYAEARPAFRERVRAHRRLRTVALGAHAALAFEDRLTVQYQVQEMLRLERVFEPAAVQAELDAYAGLVPGGQDLRATFLLEYPDPDERRAALATLGGIEHRVYVEVDGHGRATTHADEDLPRSTSTRTSAVHFMRFALSAAQAEALRAGAALVAGIEDARMPARVALEAATCASLRGDLA